MGVHCKLKKVSLVVSNHLQAPSNPKLLQNQSRGLLGNWTFDIEDDFTLPDGTVGPMMDTSNIERIHEDFAMKCQALSD